MMAATLMAASCVSRKTLTPIEEIPASSDPMAFVSGSVVTDTQTKSSSTPLTTGFMVQCWKSFGMGGEHPVMSNYVVEYKTSGSAWDGTVRPYWDYTGVEGQYQKYWDYSAFPYRFHAIAPCPADASGFESSQKTLTIPAHYGSQTCVNGMVTPESVEPYMVAQVHRNADGKDYDLLLEGEVAEKEINKQSYTLNRYVALPFHHLNTKVRFAVYCTAPWATANVLYLKDLSVYIASHDFVYEADRYTATTTDEYESWRIMTGNAGFEGLHKDPVAYHRDLLRFDGGRDVPGNDLRECQGRSSAFFLQCPEGMAQIPQENVRMCVSLSLMTATDEVYKRLEDVPVRIEKADLPGQYDYTFDWRSGYIQTYYLVIGEIDDKLEIEFTCTLTPWDDVNGALNTDLEK